ncbi:MAG: hypothetical protein AAFV07_05790, partial [Bacteroidota bacterium]
MIHLQKGLLYMALSLTLPFLQAQSVSCWSWMIADTDFEKNDAATLGPGDILWIGGTFSGAVDMNPDSMVADSLTSTLFSDAFIASYDADGSYRFAFNLPGVQILDMKTDTFGNLYVAGYHLGATDVDPGPDTEPLPVFGATDACLLSYDVDGRYRWGYSYGSSLRDQFRSVGVTAHQQILVGGSFSSSITVSAPGNSVPLTSAGGTDVCMAQFTVSGGLNWARSFGGPGFDEQATIGVDGQAGDQNWLAFSYTDSVDIPVNGGNTKFTSMGVQDVLICRIDSGSQVQAAWTIGGSSRDVPKFIATSSTNTLYLTGTYANTIDLDPGSGNEDFTSLGGQDIFVVNHTPTGLFAGGHATGGDGSEE